jgi:hypothetical protein
VNVFGVAYGFEVSNRAGCKLRGNFKSATPRWAGPRRIRAAFAMLR